MGEPSVDWTGSERLDLIKPLSVMLVVSIKDGMNELALDYAERINMIASKTSEYLELNRKFLLVGRFNIQLTSAGNEDGDFTEASIVSN